MYNSLAKLIFESLHPESKRDGLKLRKIHELNKYEKYKNKKFKKAHGRNIPPESIKIGRNFDKTSTSFGDVRNYSVDPLGPQGIHDTKAKRQYELSKAKRGESIKHNLFKLMRADRAKK